MSKFETASGRRRYYSRIISVPFYAGELSKNRDDAWDQGGAIKLGWSEGVALRIALESDGGGAAYVYSRVSMYRDTGRSVCLGFPVAPGMWRRGWQR
jgi:hypothetical protein